MSEDKPKSAPAPGAAPAPGSGRRGGQGRATPRREGSDRRGGPGGRGPPQRRRFERPAPPPWEPKTRLGRMVKKGEIKTMKEALETGFPLREPEIVDALLPDLEDEVINVNMVQRMTDSGRRVRFAITCCVGNKDGYVGLGQVKGKEVGPSIRRAIDRAKTNIIEVQRGAGSWQSAEGAPARSVPFKVTGKCASTEVTIKPAPQGTGVVAGNIAKSVLKLAGIEDAWVFAKGQTRTTTNYAKATFAALGKLSEVKMTAAQRGRVAIVAGPVEIKKDADEQPPVDEEPQEAQ